MLSLIDLLFRTLLTGLTSRRDLALENLVLRHQLQVALRNNPSPRLTNRDRVLWVWLRCSWPAWRDHLHIVKPETVLRWHRKGWRLYWTWKSRSRLGRPRLNSEGRNLIAAMSRDNPLWGSERIRGELLKLGIVVSKRSIRRYRWRKPAPGGGQGWRTFLTNELKGIWAADAGRPDRGLPDRLRALLHPAQSSAAGPLQRDLSPDRRLDLAAASRGHPRGSRPDSLIHDRDAV